MLQVPRGLTVAGSDSGGGAGIQADLKTYQARGVFGASAISALTAQNTRGVRGVHTVPTQHLYDQLEAVLSDIGADVIKTGMLPTAEVCAARSSLLLSVCQTVYLSVCLFVCLSICLSVSVSVHVQVSVCLSVCFSFGLFVTLPVASSVLYSLHSRYCVSPGVACSRHGTCRTALPL